MPFLDGMEATQAILEYEEVYDQPHVPILALTANALKGDKERFLEAGLDEYTTKPLVRAEIVTLLNHFLADYIVYDKEITDDTVVEDTTTELEDTSTKLEAAAAQEEITKEEKTYDADILIANYSKFNTKLYAKILSDLAFKYDTVNSSDALNGKLEKFKYRAVLLDSMLKESITTQTDADLIVLEDSVNKEKIKLLLEKYKG